MKIEIEIPDDCDPREVTERIVDFVADEVEGNGLGPERIPVFGGPLDGEWTENHGPCTLRDSATGACYLRYGHKIAGGQVLLYYSATKEAQPDTATVEAAWWGVDLRTGAQIEGELVAGHGEGPWSGMGPNSYEGFVPGKKFDNVQRALNRIVQQNALSAFGFDWTLDELSHMSAEARAMFSTRYRTEEDFERLHTMSMVMDDKDLTKALHGGVWLNGVKYDVVSSTGRDDGRRDVVVRLAELEPEESRHAKAMPLPCLCGAMPLDHVEGGIHCRKGE